MMNKIAQTALRTVARQTGSTLLQKTMWPLERLDKEWRGGRPLNVGEDASMRCYRAMPNESTGFCRKVMEHEINSYRRTGTYKTERHK